MHLDNLYTTVMEAEMIPSDATAEYMLEEYDLFLVHYNHIATFFMNRCELLFNMITNPPEIFVRGVRGVLRSC